MRYLLHALILSLAVTITGCAALDYWLTPRSPGEDSPAMTAGKVIAPFAGPWGEAGLLGLMLVQNGYLGIRKLQTRRRTK